jgi:hypothetical protein
MASNPLEALGITQAELDAAMASDDVKAAKIELAELAAEFWRGIAPVRTGAYRESIGVVVHGDDVSVVAADDSASYIEFGTSNTEEFSCRARTSAKFAEGE